MKEKNVHVVPNCKYMRISNNRNALEWRNIWQVDMYTRNEENKKK